MGKWPTDRRRKDIWLGLTAHVKTCLWEGGYFLLHGPLQKEELVEGGAGGRVGKLYL